jgi:hypothetical protein
MAKLQYALIPQEGNEYVFDSLIEEIPNYRTLISERFGTFRSTFDLKNLIPESSLMNLHKMAWVLKKPVLEFDLL